VKVEIFDVNHGQCAVATSPNGQRIMADCGDRLSDGRWWAPSMHYCGQSVALLALMNLDEDHLSNFPLLTKYISVGQILTNHTIGARELQLLKPQGMGRGTGAVYDWMANPFRGLPAPLPDFGPVRVWWYYNHFIQGVTEDTNDLSLVLFIQYGRFKIVFSGDMEERGWRRLLLLCPQLRLDLMGTNVFVASHHGRESGCSAELFEFFRPELVIISDAERQYGTQETDDWYRQRCLGIPVIGTSDRRYVMTTRSDGSMQIDVAPDGRWTIRPVPVPDWELSPPRQGFAVATYPSERFIRRSSRTISPDRALAIGHA